MAKKKKAKKQKGEQLQLIDVAPENAKEIIAATKVYKVHQAARLKAGKAEIAQRTVVRALVAESGLQRLPDGTIRFELDGKLFCVTPQDDLITITDAKKVTIKEKQPKPPKE